ncbi:hypothetical protein RHMOL_Rhmol11G0091500 [Rhododendron molle]|uniref:Uncharacterized protein n=1 Tax=Rhododendron molle TaxID=49168 RepID=A0ACC0LQD0_RHOML|nr:hypothetical protein RHMOL_Rhmol11G0091500 [Rhododendron molle]
MTGPDSVSGATVGDEDRTGDGAPGFEPVEIVTGNLTTEGRRRSQTLFRFGPKFVVRTKIVSVGPPVKFLECFMVPENEDKGWRRNFLANFVGLAVMIFDLTLRTGLVCVFGAAAVCEKGYAVCSSSSSNVQVCVCVFIWQEKMDCWCFKLQRKKIGKAPKIQRLVTPLTLQRKRAKIAEKKKRIAKAKTEAASRVPEARR